MVVGNVCAITVGLHCLYELLITEISLAEVSKRIELKKYELLNFRRFSLTVKKTKSEHYIFEINP